MSTKYSRRNVLLGAVYVPQWTEDEISRIPASQADPRAALYPRTAAEAAAGVTPSNYAYESDVQGWVNVRRFGVVGDGVTDDTAAIQRAFNTAKTVFFPAGMACKTTSALTYSGSGIIMDPASYIALRGSGYTALTITGGEYLFNEFSLRLEGAGATINALYLENPKGARFKNLRVNNFNGYGIKIQAGWDCLFETVSVEQCGNTKEYAFSVVDGSDTSNMTHILRLQVERSNAKAMYVSPNTLSCIIDNIHSEQLTPNSAYNAWHLGGNRCTYNNVRLHSNAPSADAKCFLDSGRSTYINLLTESSIVVTANAWSGTSMLLLEPEIQGTFAMQAGQTGQIRVFGGVIGSLRTTSDDCMRFYDVEINGAQNNGGVNDAGFTGIAPRTVSGNYTLVLEDSRRMILCSGAGGYTLTIPANSSVAFPVGTVIPIMSIASSNIFIAIATDTLEWWPGTGTGRRALSQNGAAVLRKVTDKTWAIEGLGIESQKYSASNVSAHRAYDANATTVDELANVVGTLIADLRAKGIVK
jgi:Pectate lyase superfamily protein